jgi:hypothetical protein
MGFFVFTTIRISSPVANEDEVAIIQEQYLRFLTDITISKFILYFCIKNKINSVLMQRLVIDIPENKIGFFMELIKNLGFIKKVRQLSKDQQRFVDELQTSINEVEQHQKGEIELQSARDFLDEL